MGRMSDLFTQLEEEKYNLPQPSPRNAFDGITYNIKQDHARLKGQLSRVFQLMSDGQWRTLKEIHDVIGGSEAAISARLRDLRKEKYGLHTVERWGNGNGLFRYRVIVKT